MAGRSRPKDGVASLAYDPAIPLRGALPHESGSPGRAAGGGPVMTTESDGAMPPAMPGGSMFPKPKPSLTPNTYAYESEPLV